MFGGLAQDQGWAWRCGAGTVEVVSNIASFNTTNLIRTHVHAVVQAVRLATVRTSSNRSVTYLVCYSLASAYCCCVSLENSS